MYWVRQDYNMHMYHLWILLCIYATVLALPTKNFGKFDHHERSSEGLNKNMKLNNNTLAFVTGRHYWSRVIRLAILNIFHNISSIPDNIFLGPRKRHKTFVSRRKIPIDQRRNKVGAEKGEESVKVVISKKIVQYETSEQKPDMYKYSQANDLDQEERVNIDIQSDEPQQSERNVFVVNGEEGNPPMNEQIFDDVFLESTSSCNHVTGYYKHRWLRLVVMCPTHWMNETVRKKCETWDEVDAASAQSQRYIRGVVMLPVQDNLGAVYGNVFCAICHDVYPIYPWRQVMKCDSPEYDPHLMSSLEISDLSFLQTFEDRALCIRIIVPSFPGAIESCQPHLLSKEVFFRANPLESLEVPTATTFPVTFNALMNFDFTGKTHILFSTGQQMVQNEYVRRCDVGETFDTYSKRCRPVRCSSSHRLEGGRCIPMEDSTNDDSDSIGCEALANDFDVSALHETVKVSLSVNISFGIYLIFNAEEDLNDIIAEQIAGNLNISVDRLKHVNISFDFGSINKTGYQVQRLSQEKYKELFPNDDQNGEQNRSKANGSHSYDHKVNDTESLMANFLRDKSNGAAENENRDSPSHQPLTTSANGDSKSMQLLHGNTSNGENDATYKREKRSNSMREKSQTKNDRSQQSVKNRPLQSIATFDKHENNSYKLSPNDTRHIGDKESQRNTDQSKDSKRTRDVAFYSGYSKPLNPNLYQFIHEDHNETSRFNKTETTKQHKKHNEWRKIKHQFSMNSFSSNGTNWDTLWGFLQSAQDHPGNFNYDNVSVHRVEPIKTNNTLPTAKDNDIYLSPPLNKNNERIVLGSDSEIDFNQPMAMRISFILVPPDDPESDEEEAMMLLKKISDLITDKEFTLLVSGNEVSVVNSDDPVEDKEMADQFCPWGVMFIVYDDEFTILEIDNVTLLYVNKTNTYHGIGRFDLWVMVKGENTATKTSVTTLREYAFVCFMPRITRRDCQRINLSPDEYQVISTDNRSIIFEENEYNITAYTVLNESSGEIQICVPQSYDPDRGQLLPHYVSINKDCGSEYDTVRQVEGYLTLILGRISIAAQALVLVTYFLFPSLRNLPGCNIMNLTLALFIAETIFEEGMLVSQQWRCVTVAIILHFFFLASHFWMNVMSFDVFRAFSKPKVSAIKNAKQTYFPKYFVYAWGMPVVIVGVCSFIEFSNLFSNVDIGYGSVGRRSQNPNITISYSNFLYRGQQDSAESSDYNRQNHNQTTSENITLPGSDTDNLSACWIQKPLASLLAFGAPVLLIFIANCIFFVSTIINISGTVRLANQSLRRQNSNTSNSKTSGRSEALLYLRMSTVMGFTWVFGFSSAIISSVADPITTTICIIIHIHSILFVILNTSQGLFIFVAFLCNRRVLHLYIDLFLRLKRFIRRKSHRPKIYSISPSLSTKSGSLSQLS